MTARRPTRPKLTAAPEPIVPAAPAEPAASEAAPVPTATLSVRLPAELVDRFQRQVRIFHANTGLPKGEIAAELLEEALSHSDAVEARLSTR